MGDPVNERRITMATPARRLADDPVIFVDNIEHLGFFCHSDHFNLGCEGGGVRCEEGKQSHLTIKHKSGKGGALLRPFFEKNVLSFRA